MVILRAYRKLKDKVNLDKSRPKFTDTYFPYCCNTQLLEKLLVSIIHLFCVRNPLNRDLDLESEYILEFMRVLIYISLDEYISCRNLTLLASLFRLSHYYLYLVYFIYLICLI